MYPELIRVSSSFMKALTIIPCLTLVACGGGEFENPHDSKYERVTVGTETCVIDGQTGLMWQLKSRAAGLHSADNTYSWYDPDEAVGELDYRGLPNGGSCTGSDCDTTSYVAAVNAAGLCGYSDWRMPIKDELYSISDLMRIDNPPTVNTEFFPHTHAAEYWSGNDYSFQYDAAWGWNFALGHDRVDWKKTPKYVRLVRGTPSKLEAVKE